MFPFSSEEPLTSRPNSHPFNDRNLVLDQEIKIGRSVARAKPTLTNAIFDCKVISLLSTAMTECIYCLKQKGPLFNHLLKGERYCS